MKFVDYTDSRYPICFRCKVFLYNACVGERSCVGGFELDDGSFICGGCAERIPVATDELKIPMKEIAKDFKLNVSVSGVKAWKSRLWLGGLFIRAAARIIGCGFEFSVDKFKPAQRLEYADGDIFVLTLEDKCISSETCARIKEAFEKEMKQKCIVLTGGMTLGVLAKIDSVKVTQNFYSNQSQSEIAKAAAAGVQRAMERNL